MWWGDSSGSTLWLEREAVPGGGRSAAKVNAGGGERGIDAASRRGCPPPARSKAAAVVAEGGSGCVFGLCDGVGVELSGRWIRMGSLKKTENGAEEVAEEGGLGKSADGVRGRKGHERRTGKIQGKGAPGIRRCDHSEKWRGTSHHRVHLRRVEVEEHAPRYEVQSSHPFFLCLSQDMRKTWRRFDVPTPKPSNSEDDLPEDYPVVKNMLHTLTADLTLDPGTAHHRLLISALGGAGPPPRRIRVDLDWERGRVAFYDGRSLDLLFAFQAPGPLGERIFPLFCTRDPRAPLRIVPGES
ncbi:LOW QUALITY PROTEIN: RING finger protein 39 [Carlito syrichta]|uniref:LOW QUALITY PROTEIN: RING finger protein 39 n=1 Tax=Carlito syrichta TaxID=1868482 RepID=A0A3Q0DJ47_CARSF|nr:LOW QUALITY PROTEIN: RING finger protein 39 [Carlito syrichta]